MNKPDISYMILEIPDSSKVAVCKVVNGFANTDQPICVVDMDVAKSIVFHNDLVDALMEARAIIEPEISAYKRRWNSKHPDYRVLEQIDNALIKSRVKL